MNRHGQVVLRSRGSFAFAHSLLVLIWGFCPRLLGQPLHKLLHHAKDLVAGFVDPANVRVVRAASEDAKGRIVALRTRVVDELLVGLQNRRMIRNSSDVRQQVQLADIALASGDLPWSPNADVEFVPSNRG